jgi:aldose 1-epimerase
MIPTGKFLPVANTPLDFREPKKIEEGFDSKHEQVAITGGIDHSFAVPTSKDFVVSYHDEKSGRVLEITTMEPCVHVYFGNFLNDKQRGKSQMAYQKHSGIAFETQHFPDSVHHSNFPTIVLPQGKQYFSETRLLFTTK